MTVTFRHKPLNPTRHILTATLLLAVTGCATHAPQPPQPGYKIGQPYEVSGSWYYPHEDYSYDETGIASWYGQAFHEQTTANGEIFNKNELTAAHKTLPLPTLARVTNLDNGRSIVVRINDRGPFSGSRIIDVSQRAAELLGFEQQGTAKVRVQVLADESKAIADAMRHYGSGSPAQLASTAPQQQKNNEPAIVPVSSQPLEQPSAESANIEPIKTTPEIHQQLLATKPLPEAVQLPVSGSHQIYIQAGAFTLLDNATKMQQKLSAFGQVSIKDAVVNGTNFHRVRLGPISDVSQADALLRRVNQAGVAGARIVID